MAPLTATGGHYPAPLCLLYGKRARITTRGGTGRLLYWAGLELETHSTQITQGTSAGTKRGLIRPGLGEVQRNSENESHQAWERALLLSSSSSVERVREGRIGGRKKKEEEKRKSHVSSFASVPLPQGWYWLTGFQSVLAAKDVLSCYELVRAKHAILFALLMYSSVAFAPHESSLECPFSLFFNWDSRVSLMETCLIFLLLRSFYWEKDPDNFKHFL